MKTVAVLAALLALACAASVEQELFRQFQFDFQKSYAPDEYGLRFEVFKANLKRAEALQKADPGALYGVTVFSDLTPQEFRQTHLMPKALHRQALPEKEEFPEVVLEEALPTKYDWRDKGAITPVYNQEQCGSCWAFSATETIESYHFLHGHSLEKFSMQQIVSCDTTAYGCNGGWTYSAYNYVEQAGGIDSYASYPYEAVTGTCQFKKADIAAQVTNWSYVTQSADTSKMLNWTYKNGPLSVCVDASSWQFYQGGVITQCGDQIDHCVQVTGFDTVQGTEAWTVRNSWGTSWGISGYLYVARGSDTCAIGQVVTAVTTN